MRYFNTAGVCLPHLHYMLPAEARLPEFRKLLEQSAYFVVHAPRQSGKTTALREVCEKLMAEGRYAALHFSCEAGAAFPDDPGGAERVVWDNIRLSAREHLPADLQPPEGDRQAAPGAFLQTQLAEWSRSCPRPLVLVFDEIDALIGRALISVLRQLRAGHSSRDGGFPSSVVLCGLRDVRDYKAASGGGPVRMGSPSPFNALLESLTLSRFTPEEVGVLYAQHTAATGQGFSEAAVEAAHALSGGQPWLVNALAREVIEKMGVSEEIEASHLERASERLILSRTTHLDSLADKLNEARVRRVIEPMLAGRFHDVSGTYDDDVQYALDLGLLIEKPLRPANPIYREVMARVLASAAEHQLTVPSARSFVGADGRLSVRGILEDFAGFWRENGEILADGIVYHEVAPQLVLMAYFQRVVNGGGYVHREYGVGRGRIDVLVRWPLPGGEWQREGIELKVWAEGRKNPLAEGLKQLDGYLKRLGLSAGYLVIFDRRSSAEEAEVRTRFESHTTPEGLMATVLWA